MTYFWSKKIPIIVLLLDEKGPKHLGKSPPPSEMLERKQFFPLKHEQANILKQSLCDNFELVFSPIPWGSIHATTPERLRRSTDDYPVLKMTLGSS